MGEHIRTGARPHDSRPGSLGELIHAAVRHAIEVAVDVELTTALGAPRYARCGSRCGYRNGTKPRTLTGPTGTSQTYVQALAGSSASAVVVKSEDGGERRIEP